MPSEFQSNEPFPCPRNTSRRNPPCPRNSSRRNPPPSPLEFRDAARGMGIDIFWNHPIPKLFMMAHFVEKILTVYLLSNVEGSTEDFSYSSHTNLLNLCYLHCIAYPFQYLLIKILGSIAIRPPIRKMRTFQEKLGKHNFQA